MADYNSSHTGRQIDDGIDLAHSHTNKSILDGITQEKVATWDAKADSSDIPSKVSDLTNDAGYIASESDPTVPSCVKSVTQTQLEGWDDAAAKKHIHENKSVLDGISSAQVTGWIQAANQAHSHENKATLDLITSAKWTTVYNNSHTHSNKGVIDGISSSDVANWNDANSKKHTHTNQAVIDGITAADVAKWDAASGSGFSGNYNDLYNKPTIPSKESDLVHDMSYLTEETEFKGSAAYGITSTNVSNWNDANSKKHTHTNSATLNGISDDDTASWDAAADAAHSHSNKSALDEVSSSKIDDWDDAALNSHAHSNKSVLDSITSTNVSNWNDANSKKHTHDNAAILSSIDSTDIDDWTSAALNSHTHTNQSVLDGITSAKVYSWNGKAERNEIPTVTSDLTNDSGFQTSAQVTAAISSAIAGKQDTLIPGAGITIAADGKTISATSTGGGTWGSITGTLSDQTDLQNALDAKAASADIPVNVSELNNDAGYMRPEDGVMIKDAHYFGLATALGANASTTAATLSTYYAANADELTAATQTDPLIKLSALNSYITALGGIQKKLTPGAGITIAADGTISSTSSPAATSWGSITGSISNQTDLQTALAAKQNHFNPGNGIALDTNNNLYVKTDLQGVGVNESGQICLRLGTGLAIGTSGSDRDKLICTVSPAGSVAFADITGEPTDNAELQEYFNDVYQVMGSVSQSVSTKQDILVPSTGITIAADGKTISSSTAWGSITGDITDQTDFMEYYGALVSEVGQSLAEKQDILIAGTGISIAADGKTISATGGGGGDMGKNVSVNNSLPTLQSGYTYEIKGDVAISSTVSVPSNVTFFFNGGSFTGSGSLTLNGTRLTGKVNIANTLGLTGTLANQSVEFEWFNPVTATSGDNATLLNRLVGIAPYAIYFSDLYPVASTVTIPTGLRVRLYGRLGGQSVYASLIETNATCGLYTTTVTDVITVSANSEVLMSDMTILGWWQSHSGNSLHNQSASYSFSQTNKWGTYSVSGNGTISTSAINAQQGASVGLVSHCAFNGFTQGVLSDSGYLDRFDECSFSCCRFGIRARYSSDFLITGCKFNTCQDNYDFTHATIETISGTNDVSENVRYASMTTAAIHLSSSGMVQINGCRFEFNGVHICLNESDSGVNITGCMFDKATLTNIILNAGEGSVIGGDGTNVAIGAVSICGNTFMRGARAGGEPPTTSGTSYFMIRHAKYTSGNRSGLDAKMSVSMSGNSFADDLEIDYNLPHATATYQHIYFFIENAGTGAHLTLAGNDMNGLPADQKVFKVKSGSTGTFYIHDAANYYGGYDTSDSTGVIAHDGYPIKIVSSLPAVQEANVIYLVEES